MPAPTPTSGNVQGEQAAASSQNSPTPPQNKIPLLNNRSRSFFLFLVAGAAIIGIIVVFFLVSRGGVSIPGVSREEVGQKEDPNAPAATVNGEVITRSEYQALYDNQKYYFTNVRPASDEYIAKLEDITIRRLIDDKILDLYSKEKGIDVTQDQIRAELDENVIKPSYSGDWQAYEKELTEKYKSSLDFVYKSTKRDIQIRNLIEQEKLEAYMFDEWFDGIKKNYQIENKISSQ